MDKSITVTTVKGATITIHSNESGTLSADVNGKLHTYLAVTLGHDKTIGDYVGLAGRVKAAICSADANIVRKFLSDAAATKAAWIANYKPTDAERRQMLADRLSDEMDREWSDK